MSSRDRLMSSKRPPPGSKTKTKQYDRGRRTGKRKRRKGTSMQMRFMKERAEVATAGNFLNGPSFRNCRQRTPEGAAFVQSLLIVSLSFERFRVRSAGGGKHAGHRRARRINSVTPRGTRLSRRRTSPRIELGRTRALATARCLGVPNFRRLGRNSLRITGRRALNWGLSLNPFHKIGRFRRNWEDGELTERITFSCFFLIRLAGFMEFRLVINTLE